MANVLTTAGSVACQHQGAVAAPAGAAKLTVGGKPVLLVDQVSAWTITGCTQTGPGMTPCQTVHLVGGAASKLTAGGVAVLLDSTTLQTSGVPVNTVTLTAGQAQVRTT